MVESITISPEAAADAGCTASATLVDSGTAPIDPSQYGEGQSVSGTWQQYNYSAAAAGRWNAPSTIEIAYQIVETVDGTTTTRDYTMAVTLGTQAPVEGDLWNDAQNPYIEYDVVYELHDVNDNHLITRLERTKRITSVTATFYRTPYPVGDPLCHADGVMACNSSGSLLYHAE